MSLTHENIRLFWKLFFSSYKENSHEESQISLFTNLCQSYLMLPSKWEKLSCCSTKSIYFCKKLPLDWNSHWIADRANILCKCIINIFFSVLEVAFAVPFLCYFQKFQILVVKKFWTNFCCFVFLFVWAQNKCLKFLKSFFKLDILIFLSFLVDIFN